MYHNIARIRELQDVNFRYTIFNQIFNDDIKRLLRKDLVAIGTSSRKGNRWQQKRKKRLKRTPPDL
ncbi:MAG: hypothetical protein NTZ39_00925 [Methanoregula sp.]|nr:hypothetical protein [Methanoregula sp.]